MSYNNTVSKPEVFTTPNIKGNRKVRKEVIESMTPDQRAQLIIGIQTPKGGFSSDGLEKIHIAWPPKKGWRKAFIDFGITTA